MSSFAFVTHKEKFLLMLRDDKPTIPNPNCWSLLGGIDEPGETPEQTLWRELKEEANIDPLTTKLLWQIENRWYYHINLPDNVLDTIKLGDEGQKLDFFNWDQLQGIQLTILLTQMTKQRSKELIALLNSQKEI